MVVEAKTLREKIIVSAHSTHEIRAFIEDLPWFCVAAIVHKLVEVIVPSQGLLWNQSFKVDLEVCCSRDNSK